MCNKLKRKLGGKQADWERVERFPEQPLITIITSTFNAAKNLHWTGDSILNQTYPYVQWIVADGGSEDETLAIIERYADLIDIWFSEPDKGIYDAWNKAIRYCQGDWVLFLGAGDELPEACTLGKIAPILQRAHPNHDLVYGDLLLITEHGRRSLECVGGPWEQMEGKWSMFRPKLPAHPSIFHHKSLFVLENPFDTRFAIAADTYFLLRQIREKKPLYCGILVDKMPVGGVSGKLSSVVYFFRETRLASKELGFNPPMSHQVYEFFLVFTKWIIDKILPKKVGFFLADMFRLLCGKKPRWSIR